MPSISGGEHVLGYLYEVGPVMPTGMGPVPVTHQELESWQNLTGIELHPWETRFLRALSREYRTQAQTSEKADCPPPYGKNERRMLVAKKINEIFG